MRREPRTPARVQPPIGYRLTYLWSEHDTTAGSNPHHDPTRSRPAQGGSGRPHEPAVDGWTAPGLL
jgi:hypothetical protein